MRGMQRNTKNQPGLINLIKIARISVTVMTRYSVSWSDVVFAGVSTVLIDIVAFISLMGSTFLPKPRTNTANRMATANMITTSGIATQIGDERGVILSLHEIVYSKASFVALRNCPTAGVSGRWEG
jgi:hypothetical protein